MTVARISQNMDMLSGDRFVILYGYVNDEFCDQDMVTRDIDFMLWRYFRKSGYRRIVFYEGARKIYCLDQASWDLCMADGDGPQQAAAQPCSQNSRAATGGPLGGLNLLNRPGAGGGPGLRAAPSASRPSPSPARPPGGSMRDLNALDILNHILGDDNAAIPTAVIFTHAEDISRHSFQGPTDFREFQNRMVHWARMSSGVSNRCVFVFQQSTLEGLQEIVKRHELDSLENYLGVKGAQGRNIVRIPGPDRAELLNLVHFHRIRNSMRVDWRRLDKIATWLSGENLPLAHFNRKLNQMNALSVSSAGELVAGDREFSDRPAMERLNELIGLKAVKEKVEEMTAYAEAFGGDDPGTMHMAFLGNPGTGKTTVAGLVGEILRDAGLLKRGHTVLAENRQALVEEHVGGTERKTNELINQALDGVFFIDEAHALIPEDGNDPFGPLAVKTMLARMERERNRLCVILAGYPAPIRRLIASDAGLRRRVQNEVFFEDYTPRELLKIFELNAEKGRETGKPSPTPETLEAVEKVLQGMYETRNPEDWGNAGEVRNLYERMLREYAKRTRGARDQSQEDRGLLPDDVPAEYRDFISVEIDVENLMKDLNNLVGIQPVKDFVNGMVDMIRHDQRLAEQGMASADRPMMHMLFMGNPGTGKTTVAKLMGRIFKGLGVLPKGHVVSTKGGELVGSHVGEGLDKTKEKIREALGGILFIDEIYGLTEGSLGTTYGQDVINNALVPALTDYKNSLIVIGAGYTDPVKKFLEKNDGLKSRFPNPILFPDFSGHELMDIFTACAKRNGYKISAPAGKTLSAALHALVRQPPTGFGNARDMETCFTEMKKNLAARLRGVADAALDTLTSFQAEDIPRHLRELAETGELPRAESLVKDLEAMVGLRKVKDFIRRQVAYIRTVEDRKRLGLTVSTDRSLHMVFTGNPGTGKTTIARKMGEIFKALGILSKGHLIETDRAGLVAGYVGQSALKTETQVKEALDGVLFIDEAYTLARGGQQDYGSEAVDQLLSMMENFLERLVVIVAGYPTEMAAFIESNPGLTSRFTQYVEFEDYSPEELVEIFRGFCSKGGYRISPDAEKRLEKHVANLWAGRKKGFGNGREMRTLFQSAQEMLSMRLAGKMERSEMELCTFLPEDFPALPEKPVTKDRAGELVRPKRIIRAEDLPSSLTDALSNPLDGSPKQSQGVASRLIPCIGYIEVDELDGSTSTGTGFVISPDGKFLTCFHVVEKAAVIRVRFEAGHAQWLNAAYLDGDSLSDIAVLQLEGAGFPYALLAELEYKPDIGEAVGLLSYPLGEELGSSVTYTAGVLGSIRPAGEGIHFLQIDANAYPGSSGGPLFRREDGRVIGILHGGVKQERASGINFAVGINAFHTRFVVR